MKEADIRPAALFDRYLALAAADAEALVAQGDAFVVVPCPACGARDTRPGLVKEGFTYVTCASCASLYVSPRPSPAQLADYYDRAESVRFWSTHFYKETADSRREFMFRPRARLAADLAARYCGAASGTLVDVGSGYGIFLDEVRRLGTFARLVGVEPNPALAAQCRALGVDVAPLAVEALPPGTFAADIATSFEVLEHVWDPAAFMRASGALLRPGGILLFTTLTVSGFDIQLLWERSKSVHPPHHLNLLSVEGMRTLVGRAGLEVAELSTPGELDVDIVARMAAADPSLALPRFVDYVLRQRDETARADLQRFLQEHQLSSHIRVVARRPVEEAS